MLPAQSQPPLGGCGTDCVIGCMETELRGHSYHGDVPVEQLLPDPNNCLIALDSYRAPACRHEARGRAGISESRETSHFETSAVH